MASNNLNVLMQKLHFMEKTLGPTGGKPGEGPSADEFTAIKKIVQGTIDAIHKKMEERDHKRVKFGGNNLDTLRMANEIQDQLKELDKQLSQMNEVLRKQMKDQQKYGVREIKGKENLYNAFRVQLTELTNREKDNKNFQDPKIKTLVEQKSELGGRLAAGERAANRDLTAEEEAALETFKENDDKQNVLIDKINDKLEILDYKAKNIGVQIERQAEVIQDVDVELDFAYEELGSSNSRLKKVLAEYRQPGRFCVDVILLVILLGLIGVIIKCF